MRSLNCLWHLRLAKWKVLTFILLPNCSTTARKSDLAHFQWDLGFYGRKISSVPTRLCWIAICFVLQWCPGAQKLNSDTYSHSYLPLIPAQCFFPLRISFWLGVMRQKWDNTGAKHLLRQEKKARATIKLHVRSTVFQGISVFYSLIKNVFCASRLESQGKVTKVVWSIQLQLSAEILIFLHSF